MPKIDPEACPARDGTRYPEPFRARCADRRGRRIGLGAGLVDFGANLVTVPPGAWSSQRHWHPDDDELMLMIEGELVLVEDGGRVAMRAGDIAAFPKASGDGHHLINESAADARFLVIGANTGGAEYPDIDQRIAGGEDRYRYKDGTPY